MRAVVTVLGLVVLTGCASDSHSPPDGGVAQAGDSAGTGGAGPAPAFAGSGSGSGVGGGGSGGAGRSVDALRDASTIADAASQPASDAGPRVAMDASRFVGVGPQPMNADASVVSACQDDDGDGFGVGCTSGDDCDDADPAITDACYRCDEPNEGCPCDLGTRAMFCMPPTLHVDGGTLVCNEGARYCRDGVWTDCEVVGEYVFVASG